MEVYFSLFFQICEGLKEIHQKKQYHMDLKPGNIFVKGNSIDTLTIKIGDFGCVKNFQGAAALSQSITSKTLGFRGTPRYMSPKRLRGELNGRDSDMWALGVIFYEMVTGNWPFEV